MADWIEEIEKEYIDMSVSMEQAEKLLVDYLPRLVAEVKRLREANAIEHDRFLFELSDKVFVWGKAGICVITGRGNMDFSSGGNANVYQIEGAHQGTVTEFILISPKDYEEWKRSMVNE